MGFKNNLSRAIAWLLAVIMLISCVPAIAMAAEPTYKGDPVVTELGQDVTAYRENNLNKGWKFYLGDNSSAHSVNFDDSNWDAVDLPHDFSIFQDFTSSGEAESGFLPGGTGWYRKAFTVPAEQDGKTFLLNFDGVYMHATVYVNGEKVGEHHYGYTNFAFDITDYLFCDGSTENIIAVKAENKLPSSRWYSGSGIYRDVELLVLDPVHVNLNGTAVTTPDIANGTGTVNVKTEVVNDGAAAASVTVTNTVYRADSGSSLAKATATATVAAGATTDVTTSAVVADPSLWDLDSPEMYTVVTEVAVDGETVDIYNTDFGFRWFEFKSTGFYLNGEAVKLNGVCMHHDQGALGSAAYYDAMYRQISIMKDMGCNAVRITHNPGDEDFIAICNELGMLVMEETFDGLVDPKNDNYNDFSSYFESDVDANLYGAEEDMICAEYATRSIIRRDRNAPSIIAWSFGNEIQEGTYWNNAGRYDDICANYISWANAEDGTRPVTSGDNNRGGDARLVDVINTITSAGGIAGFNYANSASQLYSLAQSYGGAKGVIIASETASATNSRGIYVSQSGNQSVDGRYHLTSFDTSTVSWGATAHDSIYNTYQYDCVAGEFVWTGFDYIGEPTPWNGTSTGDSGRGAIPNSSYFGIVETTGFPKDTYYLYRAQWNKDADTAHLVTAWDSDNYMVSGGKVPVWVYTNAARADLYLNGKLIGTTSRNPVISPAGHVYFTYNAHTYDTNVCTVSNGSGADALYSVFNVAYTAGTLSLKAYDTDGAEITLDDSCGQYTVSTPDAPAKLMATANENYIAADGSSLVYITVDVVDADGNLDTTATNNITFTLEGEGKILGVDNGDQATTRKFQQSSVLTSDTSANINAYAGKALVIVSSTEEEGQIRVNVASNGLTGETVEIDTYAVGDVEEDDGLTSYTMVKDYSVKAGTAPVLETTATGTLSDGTVLSGTVEWDEITSDVYTAAGDYTVSGVLTFAGLEPINVNAKLHVIADVIAMRNISTATTAGIVPALPSTVNGVLADGTLAGEFTVEWDAIDASALTTIGNVATVNGTASVIGNETLPVTCTIRVAQAVQAESTNVGPMADSVSQDIPQAYWSDVLASVNNGVTKPGDNTNERWTNWNYRTRSENATITMTWATAQMLSSVELYYYYDNCSAYPEAVEISYSLNGTEFTVAEITEEQVETYNLGAHYSYTFAEPVNPMALKIKLTQQGGTSGDHCVGVTEIECMTYAAALEYNTSADLSGIAADGTAIAGFDSAVTEYEAEGIITATTADNAGITVLPAYEGVVRILTISEDGSTTKTYAVTCGEAEVPVIDSDVTRLSGKGRCETAFLAADELKTALDVEKFDAIIIASGDNFADALAGSYLAAVKEAPILLYRSGYADENITYIAGNLAADGIVYILGGTAAVPEEMETALKSANIQVKRIKGSNRFETNLAILEEAGVGQKDILVATGYNFADSLSASATGMPILLVHNGGTDLTDSQKAFLGKLSGNKIVVIGGEGAVNASLYAALENYGDVERVKGSGREATSVEIAKKYFEAPSAAVVAYSRNFPDGLCGGPLAYALGAPLLLTNTGYEEITAGYTVDNGILDGFVLGGTAAVSDEIVRTVFSMPAEAEITVKR